jgi:peptidoglycan-N-acetylglucosamine deacetylase
MAVTIDDLPIVGDWQMSKKKQWTTFNNVLKALSKYQVTACGFVVGKSIQPHQNSFLEAFNKAGHKIDNHTFSHFNFNVKTTAEYIKDIELGEKKVLE